MSAAPVRFQARNSIEQVEEGNDLAPKFDDRGLITVVTTDADSGEVLMQGRPVRPITTAAAARFSGTKAPPAAWCNQSTSY